MEALQQQLPPDPSATSSSGFNLLCLKVQAGVYLSVAVRKSRKAEIQARRRFSGVTHPKKIPLFSTISVLKELDSGVYTCTLFFSPKWQFEVLQQKQSNGPKMHFFFHKPQTIART